MDEVNTSFCLGVFKEIMIDRRFNGNPLSDNIFWVAAVNPDRRQTRDVVDYSKLLFRDNYYVHLLPPSMRELVFDFGALGESQG